MEKETEEIHFKVRVYQKRELALLYFSDASPKSATVSLMRWIRQCHELHKALTSAEGYNKNRNYFLSYEVGLIIKYLGEP